jgi:hypothetical protein
MARVMETRRGEPIDLGEPERLAAGSPAHQAFQLLRAGFTVAPIVAGLDKFFHRLGDWDRYLAPVLAQILPFDRDTIMQAVGVIEIVAGLVVAFAPRFGGYLVAAWLAGIIVNLVLIPGYLDIALRDLGLLVGALALARLAEEFRQPGALRHT